MKDFVDKWCYSTDEEIYNGHYDDVRWAHGDAQCQIDDETDEEENGCPRSYWIGQCCNPLDKIEKAFLRGDIGHRIVEQVDEWLYNVVSADEQIIDISSEDAVELGKLVYNFLKEKANFSMYAVKNITEHTYIIGSNE